MLILIINLCLYIVPALLFIKEDKALTLRTLLLLFVSFSALSSIYTWATAIYFDYSGVLVNDDAKLIPYLYIWVMMFLLFVPIKNYHENNIRQFVAPNIKKGKIFTYFSVIFTLTLVLLLSYGLVTGLKEGYGEIYTEGKSSGYSIFPHYVHLMHTAYSILNIPLMLLFGYHVAFGARNRPKTTLLFIIAFIPSILFGIGGASRGMIFLELLILV